MDMKLNDINGKASEYAFGFKATSRSLKPVHLAQSIFNQILEYQYSPELLFEFLEKPSKKPSSELSEEVIDKFDFSHGRDDEELDQIRKSIRKVLANDNALYASQKGSAPTCTSDWFIINSMVGVTIGRFLYTLIEEAESDLETKLQNQLKDHHDSVSLLFRPLAKDTEKSPATIKEWREPELGSAIEEGKIATELIEGFTTLSKHLKSRNGTSINYPRDLRRVIKYASFGFFMYMANRHNEIRTDGNEKERRHPAILNYTGNKENPVANASLDSVDSISSEIQSASRLGIKEVLDRKGFKSYSEEEILRQIDQHELFEVKRNKQSKIEEDYETFRDMYTADPADDHFDKLVNTMSDAIHLSRYKTYTPLSTVETFGWRTGLLKPRGNRANERRLRPDPELLESILLSAIEPNESIPLQDLCERLRRRYGIIVGGTENDRSHLSEWDITIGASTEESDPLKNRNYEGFKELVIDLGYAREFADGVTIVSTDI